MAVVNYHAAVSVPGVSHKGAGRFAGPDGKVVKGSRVVENAAASGRTSRGLFGAWSGAEGPVVASHVDASKYPEMYATE